MRRIVVLACSLLLVVAMAACNGSADNGDGGNGGTTTPTPPGTTPTPTATVPAGQTPDNGTPDNGGADDELVAQGEAIFTGVSGVAQPACATCHQVTTANAVGPGLGGIATKAGQRVPGLSAEEYLRQSILEPNEYVVEGFPPDLMPQTYGEQLSDEQIDALVAYLMTLQ